MTIAHHPSDETLARRAGGTLPAGVALVVDTHLLGCARCRELSDRLQCVAAVMAEDMAPTPMTTGALAHALERTRRPSQPAWPVPRAAVPRRKPRLPEGLAWPPTLADRDAGRWLWLGPNVRVSRVAVPEDPGADVALFWIKAGTRMPEHEHLGSEYTLVLEGSYADGVSRYLPGDLLEADADFEHRPVVDPDADCICLAAVAGGVRLRGWLGRLLHVVTGPR